MAKIDLFCPNFWAIRRLLVVITGSLMILAVQSVASYAQVYTYDQIDIEGNIRIDAESVLRFADLPPSGQVTADELGVAYRGIADAGIFESFEIRPEGNRIVIEVVEYPIINEISIEGNRRIDDEALLQVIQSTPRRVYLPSQAAQDSEAIAEQYLITGRYAADVSPKIIRRSDNRVDLVFEVIEGDVVENERISFVGNTQFSDSRLRRELATKQAGLFSTFVRSDTYIAERLELDKQNLINFYNSRGYMNFEILSVSAETTTERDAFFIVFSVSEGPQYTFGEIQASSELEFIDTDEYLKEFRGKTGNLFSPALVSEGVRRMEFLANSRDLRFIFVDPERDPDFDNQSINLNFRIFRGAQQFVERIDIVGNTTTFDRVIRREFEIAEGDPYNQREIDDAQDRIRRLGYFSSVDVSTREGASPDQAVVTVDVEERPTGSLSFGGAWSPDTGITGTIRLIERNLLGRGQTLSFGLETGKQASYLLQFIEPRLLDRDLSLTLSTSLQTSRGLGQRFNTEQLQFSGNLSFFVSESTLMSVGTGYATYRMRNLFSASYIVREDEKIGKGDRFFFGYDFNYDSRRTSFNPDNGYVLKFGQRLSQGVSDKTTMLTTEASVGGQIVLLNGQLTLTGEIETGLVTPVSGKSRLRDRFRMNSGLMRGFSANGIGPRDFRVFTPATPNTPLQLIYLDPLGGEKFAALRLDARFPIGLPDELGIQGGLFYDMGSIWGLSETKCSNYSITNFLNKSSPNYNKQVKESEACKVNDSFDLRSSFGFTLFWNTLFGPLRMNFENPIRSRPYDQTQRFSVTVDTQF